MSGRPAKARAREAELRREARYLRRLERATLKQMIDA